MFGKKQPAPQEKPFYEANLAGFWVKVYLNRVEFNAKGVGQQSIPIHQIASVQQAMMGIWEVTLETTGGVRYTIPTRKKQEVQRAIYDAQSQAAAQARTVVTTQTSGAEEIAKLHQLMQQGIITQQEFEQKKNQILGL